MKNKSFWPPKNQVIYAIKTSKNVYTVYIGLGAHVKIIQMFSMNRTWIVHNIVWGSLTWHVDPSAMRGGFDEQACVLHPKNMLSWGYLCMPQGCVPPRHTGIASLLLICEHACRFVPEQKNMPTCRCMRMPVSNMHAWCLHFSNCKAHVQITCATRLKMKFQFL